MDLRTSTVIGLAGASGGLGTSTLAAAVAGLTGETRRAALLVDLVPNTGGLDQLVGCAHEPGQRWPAREEGMLSLRSYHLPAWRGVRVLSQHGPVLPTPPLGPAAVEAVARLADDHDVAVLDLPRPDHPHAERWFELCGTVVLVAGSTPSQVAAALVTRELVPAAAGLVVRAPREGGLEPQDVAQVLGLPLLDVVAHDPSVPRSAVEQEWPGSADGAVRQAAATVLATASGAARTAA